MPQFLYKLNDKPVSSKKINHYVLLPDFDCLQETLHASIPRVPGCQVIYVGQLDGSRMRVITSGLSQISVVSNLFLAQPNRDEIYLEDLRDDFQYDMAYLIWVHTFLNGTRVVPIQVNTVLKTFKDVSREFTDLRFDDGLGILAPYTDDGPVLDLAISGGVDFKLISFLCKKRMCHCCGLVSDITKPRAVPWATRLV